MTNEASSKKKTTRNEQMDTSTADRGIIPADVAARMDREGDDFKKTTMQLSRKCTMNNQET